MNIEANVIKKTNKYVYLSDGTHMSHSDYHNYKTDIRRKLSLVHEQEYKDSMKVILADMKQLEELQEEIYFKTVELQQSNTDWEKYYRDQVKETDAAKDRLVSHARILYKDLKSLPILESFQTKGIKFIIQENKHGEYRFCFDPYQLGANFHSTLSDFYRSGEFYTKNGGWMRIEEDNVILYGKSGDYGVYDNDIALNAAREIFPNKNITSFAGETI